MLKYMFSIYDEFGKYYLEPMSFDDRKSAVTSVRKRIRHDYVNGDITLAELQEMTFVCVGTFDTISGQFVNSYEEIDYSVSLVDFVQDLAGESDEV